MSSPIISATIRTTTGHLAQLQIVSTTSGRRRAWPMASTTGPLSTSMATTSAANSTPIRVISSCSGLSFQTLRPSGVSYTTLAARVNAPT